MDSDTKLVAIIFAVLVTLILVFSGSDTPSDYPADMDSCMYTGPGGWDC